MGKLAVSRGRYQELQNIMFATNMKKKIDKRELEEAINNLDLSLEAKKSFASQLRLRNESFICSYIVYAMGILYIVLGFGTDIHRARDKMISDHTLLFCMGIFLIVFAQNRIKTMKLHRATVELIMKNKGSESDN